MYFYTSFPFLITLFVVVISSTDATNDGLSGQALAERQKLPSIETIKRFLATFDQQMIDRILSTIKIANLVAKLRKIFQLKQQLRDGLNKRMEMNGNGLKSIDKSLKLLLSPTNWSSKLRYNKKTSDKPIEQNPTDSVQHIVSNQIADNHNVHIENMQNNKL